MYRYLFLALLFIIPMLPVRAGELRLWTGSNGKVIEAELLSLEGEIVKMKLKDGRLQNIRIDLFSKEDQKFIKESGLDNPFATNDSKQIGPLRITLHLPENGEGHFRVEKSTDQRKSMFNGEQVHVHSWSKTLAQRNNEGLLRILHDFSDADSIDKWCENINGDLRIDNENKVLTLRPNANGDDKGSFKINGYFRLPFNSVFEISGKESGIVQFDVKALGKNSNVFQFKIDFSTKTAEGVLQESNSTKMLFRKNDVSFNSLFQEKFQFNVSKEEARNLHGLSVYYKVDPSLQGKSEPLRISILEVVARFVPLIGVTWGQKGSDVFVNSVLPYRAGEKAGIRQGDIVKAINGKKMTNSREVTGLIWDSRIGDELILTIDRRGEEIVIKVRLEI